jgi:hypothetical protein
MKTIRDLLRDADPLRHEPQLLPHERERVRQVVLAAASDIPASRSLRTSLALVVSATLIVIGIVAVGSRMWSPAGGALQAAAVRFEVRLAEPAPAAGLEEVRISGSDHVVYLHQEVVVSNVDVAQSRIVRGQGPSQFGISVEFNAAGAQKMREATARHIGRPLAIIIDGEVVAVPVVRSPISASAVISGDFTQAEAERIVNGIGVR